MKRFVPLKRLKRLGALLLAMALTAMMLVVPAMADDVPEVAKNAREGVFVIELGYVDPTTNGFMAISRGTCFLINETTVLTCYHCAHITGSAAFSDDSSIRDYMAATFGDDWEKRMKCRVYYQAGNYYLANEIGTVSNADYDYTALELESAINDVTPLALGETSSVDAGSSVVALGYKYESQLIEDPDSAQFTDADINLSSGNVSKITQVSGMTGIAHDASVQEGCSGGPLLNSAGAVVGINFAMTEGTENNNYALNIDMVRNALDKSGIDYSTTPGPSGKHTVDELSSLISSASDMTDDDAVASAVENAQSVVDNSDASQDDIDSAYSELQTAIENHSGEVDTSTLSSLITQAENLNEDDYTEDSYAAVTEAKDAAQEVLDNDAATQDDVDSAADKLDSAIKALEEQTGMDNKMIMIIAAVVIAIIIVVIIVVVVSGGKKKGKEDNTATTVDTAGMGSGYSTADYSTVGGSAGNYSNGAGGYSNSGPSTAVDYSYSDVSGGSAATGVLDNAGQTTTLSGDAGETSILMKAYATLSRKNGEQITVNRPEFVIGRKRSKEVTYCINNTNVSGKHAKLMQEGNSVVLYDLGSTNGTLVNGIRCEKNQKVTLKDGDKITLADEEFTIHLL